MDAKTLEEIFDIDDLMHLPQRVMEVIEGDLNERNSVYMKLLEANNHDLSHDWFQEVYEAELAQRSKFKQDFTPRSVATLLAKIAGTDGASIHEPTAGTGGLVIAAWWDHCRTMLPWNFRPSRFMVNCWELSDRAIPLLLLNLSIRGMMGEVYHGDTLELTVKQKYILLNRNDDALAFSEIHKVPLGARIVKQ